MSTLDDEEREGQTNDDLLEGLRTGDWLDAQSFPPLRWAVPGLVPEGMSLLIGGPKIGKSWLILAVALAVASGGYALGRVPVGPARPVLLLALEDGDRRLQDRIRTLQPGEPIPARLHYMTRIGIGLVVPTIEAWLQTVAVDAEPLVILDTLGKVMPEARAGESAYQRDYRVSGRLKLICDARPGTALVVLHHDRKASSDDFVDGVSGTNGIAGAADTIIVISRPRNETQGLLKVTGRDVVEGEYAVSVIDGCWTLMGDTLAEAAGNAVTLRETANLSDRTAEVLRFVVKHPEGVRAGDVAKAVEMPAKEAGVYLGRLYKAGKIRKPERGVFAPVVSVVSVASEGDDNPEDNSSNTYNTARRACAVCGFPLDASLIAEGETTHPNCGPS